MVEGITRFCTRSLPLGNIRHTPKRRGYPQAIERALSGMCKFAQGCSKTARPPTTVIRTSASRIKWVGIFEKSRSKRTRSANFPASIDPFSFSPRTQRTPHRPCMLAVLDPGSSASRREQRARAPSGSTPAEGQFPHPAPYRSRTRSSLRRPAETGVEKGFEAARAPPAVRWSKWARRGGCQLAIAPAWAIEDPIGRRIVECSKRKRG